jgi:hypothetical protein
MLPLTDILGAIRHRVGAFNNFVFLPHADYFSTAGQNKYPISMAQAVLEIADKLLTGAKDHGPVTVDAIALDTFIGINAKWSDDNQYKNRDEK